MGKSLSAIKAVIDAKQAYTSVSSVKNGYVPGYLSAIVIDMTEKKIYVVGILAKGVFAGDTYFWGVFSTYTDDTHSWRTLSPFTPVIGICVLHSHLARYECLEHITIIPRCECS